MNLTDKNGNNFIMSLSQLTDMTTDLPESAENLTDHVHTNVTPFDVQILDAEGEPLNVIQLADSIKADPSKRPSAIDVTFEATHSGRNANYFQYDSADLERDAHTWMSPFPKPLIKNHDMWTEPMGRVLDFSFGPSEITEDADCINVTYRVTDADAIDKFLDKRYHTMSIGAKVSNIRCNTCGKDVLKDGAFKFCGHMRGESYAGQKAYWTAKDFEFKEGSIVNSPADKWAQVKRIRVVKDDADGIKDSEGDSVNGKGKPVPEPAPIKDNEDDASLIDNILGQEAGTPTDAEGTEPGNTQDGEPESGTVLTDGEQLANMQSLLDGMTGERDGLQVQLTDSETKVQNLMDERAELEGRMEDTETASKGLRQQNARLAVMNKTLLVDRAMDFEQRVTALTDEEAESRRTELTQMKATELSDLIQSHLDNPAVFVRHVTPVASPGLSDNSDAANVKDDVQGASAQSTSTKTFKDLEDAAVNLFTRKY